MVEGFAGACDTVRSEDDADVGRLPTASHWALRGVTVSVLSRARVTVPCKQSLLPKIIVDFNQSAFLFKKLTPNFERTFTPRG